MQEIWRALLAAGEAGELVALATVVGVEGSAPRAPGARMLVWPDGRTLGTVGGGNFEHRVIQAAEEVFRTLRPRRFAVHLTRDLGMCCGGAMDVYIEPVGPVERLVVYGAGHVAHAFVPIAAAMGFHVTVVDERDELNTAERFPDAIRVVGPPRDHARGLEVDERTWIFVTTHDHALDQDLLELLVARPWAWLGLIGSRSKVAKFFVRLRQAGVPEALFSRVNAPVGLDLGAETPAEIAVAVAAELVKVRRRRPEGGRSMAEDPLPARGGDGVGRAPRLRRS